MIRTGHICPKIIISSITVIYEMLPLVLKGD
jgi:hypothetical protein